ncbi:conserved hypothetical protein [Bacteriophage APSE-6]|nr:conserved hypothetical protein [Bacteriophage APSE-6]
MHIKHYIEGYRYLIYIYLIGKRLLRLLRLLHSFKINKLRRNNLVLIRCCRSLHLRTAKNFPVHNRSENNMSRDIEKILLHWDDGRAGNRHAGCYYP